MKKFTIIIFIALLSLVLVSCLDETTKIREQEVAITHEVSIFDKNDINGDPTYKRRLVTENFVVNPKVVITFSLGVADTFNYLGLDTLGIESFGLPKGGQGLPPTLSVFNSSKYFNVGTLFDPDYNVLDLMFPDLIILDGRTSNLYEKLKKDYPQTDILDLSLTTYNFETQKDHLNNLSKIFTNIGNRLDNKITEFANAFEEISLVTNNYKAMFVLVTADEYSVSNGITGRYGLVHKEFGFLEADSEGHKFDRVTSHGGEPVEMIEYVTKIKPEVILILDRNVVVTGEQSELHIIDELKGRGISAIDNDYVFYLNPYAWYTVTGGINSTSQMIDDIYQFVTLINK